MDSATASIVAAVITASGSVVVAIITSRSKNLATPSAPGQAPTNEHRAAVNDPPQPPGIDVRSNLVKHKLTRFFGWASVVCLFLIGFFCAALMAMTFADNFADDEVTWNIRVAAGTTMIVCYLVARYTRRRLRRTA